MCVIHLIRSLLIWTTFLLTGQTDLKRQTDSSHIANKTRTVTSDWLVKRPLAFMPSVPQLIFTRRQDRQGFRGRHQATETWRSASAPPPACSAEKNKWLTELAYCHRYWVPAPVAAACFPAEEEEERTRCSQADLRRCGNEPVAFRPPGCGWPDAGWGSPCGAVPETDKAIDQYVT